MTIVHHSYTSLAGCWRVPTAGTSITCRVETVTMTGHCPLAINKVLKKVKGELETALFSEKATNWPADIIAT